MYRHSHALRINGRRAAWHLHVRPGSRQPPGHRASQGASGCRQPRAPGHATGITLQMAECQWPAPPSVSSHHGDAPKCYAFGARSFFLFLLLPFAFPPIFMRRVSIYPDTSSPLWVSAGRAQTTNPRRYFPQSSIWLGWQAPQAACWELAEEDRGGATGRQPRSVPTPAPRCRALGCPAGGAGHFRRALGTGPT